LEKPERELGLSRGSRRAHKAWLDEIRSYFLGVEEEKMYPICPYLTVAMRKVVVKLFKI
jgi:hypothetical protein